MPDNVVIHISSRAYWVPVWFAKRIEALIVAREMSTSAQNARPTEPDNDLQGAVAPLENKR
jgi:hypothetical protein